MIVMIKKNKKIIQLCHDIQEDIEEIRITLNQLDKKANTEDELLFKVDYICDCIGEIEEKIIELQSKFTTNDKYFIAFVTNMEHHIDDRKLNNLSNEVISLLRYVYS